MYDEWLSFKQVSEPNVCDVGYLNLVVFYHVRDLSPLQCTQVNTSCYYSIVWYGMVWYDMVWYGMVWYGIV